MLYICIILIFLALVMTAIWAKYLNNRKEKLTREKEELKTQADKFLAYFNLSLKWIEKKQSGRSVRDWLEAKGYHTVAIYGMGRIGELLAEEIGGDGIEILYGIDQDAWRIYADFDVVLPSDNLAPVDVIIVTVVGAFSEIQKMLMTKSNSPIISLEDIFIDI